jgi:predicted nucleotide-binding protein
MVTQVRNALTFGARILSELMASIVLVDDDLASDLLVDNLRQRGHEVRRLCSTEDALEDVTSLAKADLVVLDLIMPFSRAGLADSLDGPRCAGMWVYRELRKLRQDLPLLIYTANQDPAPIDVINADPYARYVPRWSSPSFREFIEIIHNMLGVEVSRQAPRPFIVHGHDDKTKLELKNYLQNTLNLREPIILHEQPSMGRTLIDKFEDYAFSTDLAFVVLTPDDRVAAPSDGDPEKRRARQNVIFELGFFLAALGRRTGRVFLLYKGELELPSDLSGVIYIDITNGIESAGETIRRELLAMNQERTAEVSKECRAQPIQRQR